MKLIYSLFTLLLLNCQTKINQTTMEDPKQNETSNPKSIYSISLVGLDGKTIDLSHYKGKKILFVNTASECGYTPQYAQLEELYQAHKDKLVIIGIPTNDFGGQEPGTNQEITSFCKKKYGVSFPMAEKLSTKGADIAPIFKFLCLKSENGVSNATIDWNFNKFLIDENGFWVAYFPSSVSPTSDEIISKL